MISTGEPNGKFMLGQELDILMAERSRLLRVAGAAAQFVALMEGRGLPAFVATEAELLAQSVNALPEDTLRDSLAAVTGVDWAQPVADCPRGRDVES